MRIPKTFTLADNIYNVSIVDDIDNQEEGLNITGEFNDSLQYVKIKNEDGKTLNRNTMELSFYHELVHCILNNMGEQSLSLDERFVEGFARYLKQSINSFTYSDENT